MQLIHFCPTLGLKVLKCWGSCFVIIIVIKIISVKINNSFVRVGVGGRCNSYCSDITRNYEHRAHTK